jgi:hypothetical protein
MDITCLLSAIFFFAANMLTIIYYAQETRRDHYDEQKQKDFDPEYIKLEWDWRTGKRPLYLSASIINALAWFSFTFPIIQLAWILSRRGKHRVGMHIAIAALAVAGSLTEWISRFLYIGSSMATKLITDEFNLENWISDDSGDDLGWRTVEMVDYVARGLYWYVDAFEWLAFFFIMIMVHISVNTWRKTDGTTFGNCWNALGLFIALFSVLDFAAEILRLKKLKTFAQIAFWYAAANRMVFIPSWLIILGLRLPFAAVKTNQTRVSQDQDPNGEFTGTTPNINVTNGPSSPSS